MIFSASELERYSKQILINNIGGTGQRKLKLSRILVIGAGGLGSPVLTYLASVGIGTIGIIDYDKVELSNLQRQFIHSVKTIGSNKALSARKYINYLNPEINTDIYDYKIKLDNCDKIILNYDIVIDASDNFKTRFIVSDSCDRLNKPYIMGAVRSYEGQVSTFTPYEENEESILNPRLRDLYSEENIKSDEIGCKEEGVLGVTTGLIGTLMATEAIKLIVGIGNTLIGKLLLVDLLNMRFEEIRYKRK
jgi:molybdopterin/thiamine biosynthesis adenylyltransferase